MFVWVFIGYVNNFIFMIFYYIFWIEIKWNKKKIYIFGNFLEVVLVLLFFLVNFVDMNIIRSKLKRNYFFFCSGVVIFINDVRGVWNF